MSERKVLNKYYPPDFDPSKIPKLREPKNKTFSIRIMAPFNMRCNVCGEYIYKGKKFNSRKENVDDEDFLGLRIFRFYIRCPKCVAEIAFKTDLKNTDYTLEAGATRLFEAEKLAQQMAEQERLEKEAEELNPMTVLENRTKASHKEMAQIDELEELREISARHAKVDTQVLLEKQRLYEEHLLRLQQEEEDQMIQSIFGSKQGQVVKRLADADSDEEEDGQRQKYRKLTPSADQSPADLLTDNTEGVQSSKQEPKKMESWKKSVGSLSSKNILSSLVRKKPFSSTSVVSDGTKAAAEQQSRVHDTVKISSDELIRSTQETKSVENQSNQTSSQQPVKLPITEKGKPQTSSSSSALGLLGGYSGSETDSDNSG